MLDTTHCLALEPPASECPPIGEELEKAALKMDLDRQVYHSLKEVLQLKLQQRRTREELVSQGIMPPLKSPAAFHEQRRSLERARTEDYLKRKIRSRPERSELVRMHILEETSAEPSLQAKQLQLKRARLADDLNDKISHRPGPIELVHKNILSVELAAHDHLLDSPKGECSSLDEDSSDALSPEQPTNQDSPLSALPPMSPSEGRSQSGDLSPTQFLTQPLPPPAPPPPPPLPVNGSESPLPRLTSTPPRPSSAQLKSQTKSSSDRPPQRSKKAKDNKPKVKKLKYHQYIPPDQKADRERPPQMDSSYAKLLQQQQLFLQLQILSQQQQHYNYHTILPAPPKPPNEQPPTTSSGPSPSRAVAMTTTTSSSNQSSAVRPAQTTASGAKPGALPSNLDEFKVAELKAELKLRGLTVSGTKNDLIERLRNYQEQSGAGAGKHGAASGMCSGPSTLSSSLEPPPLSGEGPPRISLTSLPGQELQPHQVMRFGSTSSSPPASPSPSERSLPGMSPDETSCSGDMFGEMVSSPLTQLSLHPSPQPPSLCPVKDEGPAPSCEVTMETSAVDKDQMLQEKDKQIEELTRMLRQKQRLVETLRSQLEQGKNVKEEEAHTPACVQVQAKPPNLIKASAIQPPVLPNGVVLRLKKEEPEEKMEEENPVKKAPPPMQCSQETLLRLQQIHRLQVQQAEQHKLQQKVVPQQRKDAQSLLRQQQQIQQLIIQQTQQKAQTSANQRAALSQTTANQRAALSQTTANQRAALSQTTANQRAALSQTAANQRAALSQTTANQRAALSQATANQRAALSQQKKQKVQQRQKQTTPVSTQQVASVVINQQNGGQIHTQAVSLDLLKTNGAPTLVTDSNGNHYLIALTSAPGHAHNGLSSLGKSGGRITLQRLQSSPSKLPSSDTQAKEQAAEDPLSRPHKKAHKAGLQVDVSGTSQPGLSLTAPPSLTPFFDDSDSDSIMSSLKENGVNTQQMDDLFDILLKSGEIPGFRSNPDPSLAPLHSSPPSPPSPPSLHLSPRSSPLLCPPRPGPRSPGRLEDFLESTTGAPLIGAEGAGLTLIDDLHSQMLSTPSILEQPPSPMDTSELGLGFGDPLDTMDWLDISMGGGGEREGGPAAPLAQSVFSADFLDTSDLQLHWESCL